MNINNDLIKFVKKNRYSKEKNDALVLYKDNNKIKPLRSRYFLVDEEPYALTTYLGPEEIDEF